MTTVFVCGDPVVNAQFSLCFTATHRSPSWCDGIGCHCLQYTVTPSVDPWYHDIPAETATHIGIREAEDWFRPIDLAKECDIYISSRSGSHKEILITYGYTQDPFKNRSQNFKPKIKENYPQYLERENKNCFICGDSSHYARDCEKRFNHEESNDHIHNRINVNTLKIESEKQNSDEFANLQYVNIFVENQPVTALIDSGCQIPVLNSSLIRVQTPSEEIITLSSCFGEQRMVEVKPINLSLNQHSPGLSVRTAISPTLTEKFIIHPSVYAEIKKLGHAESDVLLSECGSSLGVHFNSNVSVPILCKKVNGAMKTSSVNFNAPSPMESKHRRFVLLRKIFQPWQWKRRKKRNRFEQTSRTIQRKISMRSTKDQLVKKDVLLPVKHNVFLWNLPDVEESLSVPSFLYVSDYPLVSMEKEKREVPLRTAYSQAGRCGMLPKAKHSLRAQAQLSETKTETMRTETVETFELVKVEPKL
ncbi:phosphatase and actin regulator 2 [Trichonephila clavipes]|nr:phosphatase and actin regulator 2 [Trichonephila clavipes]